MCLKIPLKPYENNRFVLIDECDALLVTHKQDVYPYQKNPFYIWRIKKSDHLEYACASFRKPNGKWTQIRMHRLILFLYKNNKNKIDHIDGNGLNNCRNNLRICTQAENSLNQHKIKNGTSNYKGVSWSKSSKKWMATAMINYKTIYLGCFDIEKDAAKAYNNYMKENAGEFACLNKLN